MLLIGIKNVHASGSTETEFGHGGFSIDANTIHVILKEGFKEDLIQFVEYRRKDAEYAKKKMAELNDRLEWDKTLTEEQYDTQYDVFRKMMEIEQYSQLLIVDGFVV